ncbi:biotin--[acetyl-CoA-carboxylase] ligase [Cecembia rubra]|uniref:BirA family biotin operon repressor/biotin-[acetyl-CoA-carboxylase] ligase n=1 Tax=Cecembia rubra TaxID=1485585 RepID=A0A2P8E9W5_9BACT|nr:biotin--[acetyl-CoA-carboxylase] ligase [Cecembia rubra]PSL06259.1 BirA family biotin operon repressor/biotin-[acetyl-CoA-carboxylase] ligase [Cecembia rubra]
MHKILANTVFLGKDIHFLTECHSTNDLALEKIRNREVAEGSIVIADSQTKGRGQRGNRWWSEPNKNLTFSLVLQPFFLDPSEQFELNIAVSLAVSETLSDYVKGIKLKWPNDILHEEKGKIGGILIENILNHKGIEYSVVGIGLNINQSISEIPFATSFFNLTAKEWDRWEIFKLLISKMEKYYILLKKGEKNQLRRRYVENLYRINEIAEYDDGEVFEGEITGIEQSGKLIIKKSDGSLNYYGFKEVKYL